MAGNVSEWCLDAYNADFYSASPSRNPLSGVSGNTLANLDEIVSDYTGVNVNSRRVLRGGNWGVNVRYQRVADRFNKPPTFTKSFVGFRCVSAVPADPPTPEPEPPAPEPEPPAPPAPAGMVLIPAGDFQMGSNDADARDDEQPVHTVYVDAFYMDTHEVTNAEYKTFVLANPQWQKTRIPDVLVSGSYLFGWEGNNYPVGKGDHPVTDVPWYAAMAYSAWVGKRLPTEAEWEKAARGGWVGLKYPWGNTISPSNANYGTNVGDTSPVGSYAANGYGLFDMAGNVWEWCLDEWDADFYSASPSSNPLSGVSGSTLANLDEIVDNFTTVTYPCILRGGGWNRLPRGLRAATRNWNAPTGAHSTVGFRWARAVTP